jgi:hypothetical protein
LLEAADAVANTGFDFALRFHGHPDANASRAQDKMADDVTGSILRCDRTEWRRLRGKSSDNDSDIPHGRPL